MKRYNEEQLTRMYAQDMKDYGCYTIFMFILQHSENSSLGKVKDLEEWLSKMTRECRKAFLLFLYVNEVKGENYRLITTTIQSL